MAMMCQCEKGLFSNLFTLLAIVLCTTNDITAAQSCTYPPDPSARCEVIDYEMCLSFSWNMTYNSTSFPNVFGHTNLAESRRFLDNTDILNIVERLNCSPYTTLLVCSSVFPLCTPGVNRRVDPCRELCTKVRSSCEDALIRMGYSWPSQLVCNIFPQVQSELCIYHDSMCGTPISPETTPTSVQQNGNGLHSTPAPSPACSGHLTLINDTQANFASIQSCAEPCDGIFFEKGQNLLLSVWTVALSLLSMVISVLICLTFVVSYRTIKNLEMPLYYIAFCYALLGLVNTVSIAIGNESITCDQNQQNAYNQSLLISSGLSSPLCSVLFSFTYYSTLCTWSWWVALTMEWCVTGISNSDAGNIFRVSMHFLAWGIPLLFLLAALISGEFSGSPITQSCWVHKDQEIPFLLAPLAISFFLCSFVAVISFIRVTNLQNKRMKGNRVETPPSPLPHPPPPPDAIKPPLLVRVGSYVAFYLLPMGGLLCCYLYQYWFRKQWEQSYLNCTSTSSLQLCETVPDDDKPLLPVLVTQITSSLFMGFVSIFWLLRRKSLLSWKNFCCVWCCCVWNMRQYELTARNSPLTRSRPSTVTPIRSSRESQV